MRHIDLENLEIRFSSQVCHLNVKTVEMYALHALFNSMSKSTFTYEIDTFSIVSCTILMEFSEKLSKLYLAFRIANVGVPETTNIASVFAFLVSNNLFEVPWESESISMLLFAEFHIDSKSLILVCQVKLTLFCSLLILTHHCVREVNSLLVTHNHPVHSKSLVHHKSLTCRWHEESPFGGSLETIGKHFVSSNIFINYNKSH